MVAAATTLTDVSHRCRLTQKQANDIRWFFSDAQGELGLRAMNLEPSHGKTLDFDDTKAAAAQERYDKINVVLDAIGHHHTRTLQRYYEPAVWRGLTAFESYAGLSLVCSIAKAGYRNQTGAERVGAVSFDAWLRAFSYRISAAKASVSSDERRLFGQIQAECERLLTHACRAYQKHEMLISIDRRKERIAKMRSLRPWVKIPDEHDD